MKSVAEIREKFLTKSPTTSLASPSPPLLSCLTARPWQPQTHHGKDGSLQSSQSTGGSVVQAAKETEVASPQAVRVVSSCNVRLRPTVPPPQRNTDASPDKTRSNTPTAMVPLPGSSRTSPSTLDKERDPITSQVKTPPKQPAKTASINSEGINKLPTKTSPAAVVASNGKDNSLVSQMKNKFEIGTRNSMVPTSPAGSITPRCKPLLKPKPQVVPPPGQCRDTYVPFCKSQQLVPPNEELSEQSDNCALQSEEESVRSDSDGLPPVQLNKGPPKPPDRVFSEEEPNTTPLKLSEDSLQTSEQVSTAWCRRPSISPPPSPPPKPPKPPSSGAISCESLDQPPPLPLKPSSSFLHSAVSPPKRPPPLPPPLEAKGKPLPPWPPEDSLDDGKDLEDLYDDGEVVSSSGAERFALKSEAEDGNSSQTSGDYAEASLRTDSADQDEGIYEEMEPRYDQPPDEAKQRRAADKRLRREQKEQEKRKAKWRDKYDWSEDLRPVESGIAKRNVRGKNHDVGIREGETVRILRIDKNPPGKWLIQNEKGKIGYVDLTNIDVDADSIRSVMLGPTYETLATSYGAFSSNSQWIEEEEDLYQDISNWSVPLPSPPPR